MTAFTILLCSTRCVLHFGDDFGMKFSSILLSSRDLRALSSLIFVVRVLLLSSGPTPIHAPRPRPITHSVGIGTRDFGGDSVDVSTQGGPPQLDLSSFFQDLCPTGTSSPVRAPMSVLSPVWRRSFTAASPPSVRVTLCRGTSTRDEVEYVEVATDTGITNADKTVQAVVSYCDVGTVYDPPTAPAPVASVPEDAVPDIDVVASGPASLTSLESSVEIPDDFTVDGSLAARSESGDAGPAPGSGPEETSPLGASLIDSDDEPIASRLPGYLNSFKTCEVSALQFSSIHLSHFSSHLH